MTAVGAEVRVLAELVVRMASRRAGLGHTGSRVRFFHRVIARASLGCTDDALLPVLVHPGLDEVEFELQPSGGSADGIR